MKKIFKPEYILTAVVGILLSAFDSQAILMIAVLVIQIIFGVLALFSSKYIYIVYAWMIHAVGLLFYQEYGVVGYIVNLVIMFVFMAGIKKIQQYLHNRPIEIETDQ